MRSIWAATAVVVAAAGAATVRADGVSASYVPVGDEVSAVTAAAPSSVGLQAGELHAVVATADEPPRPATEKPGARPLKGDTATDPGSGAEN